MITLLVLAFLAAWGFAPRFLSGSTSPRVQQLADFLKKTGRYLGLAWLLLFIASVFYGVHLFASMDSR